MSDEKIPPEPPRDGSPGAAGGGKATYYAGPQAPGFMDATEPFQLFEHWFEAARTHELNDPEAMAVASVDTDGMPNVRMVLLKALDPPGRPDRGFVFYTNLESAKGIELLASQKAALLFHWKSLRRQVRIRGTVGVASDAEADAYFATRARGSRIGAWASRQSRPMSSRYALKKAAAAYGLKYAIGDIPRPPQWSGFRVTPLEIEFWHDRPFRLHDRLVFRRDSVSSEWRRDWLFP